MSQVKWISRFCRIKKNIDKTELISLILPHQIHLKSVDEIQTDPSAVHGLSDILQLKSERKHL